MRFYTIKMKKIKIKIICLLSLFFVSCDGLDNDRIPAVAVNIAISDIGQWNTYGVSAYGEYKYFIRESRLPSNFPYTETTYTGYGGVLLIGGMDPFTAETNVPLAYDLACPVECKPSVRVAIDPNTLEAVCPQCGSHYDVVMTGGAPVDGPALTGEIKYKLQSYTCSPTASGGYIIRR